MNIRLSDLWCTQRKLHRIHTIPDLMTYDKFNTKIKLQYCEEDDQIEIINGHHRCFALLMARKELDFDQYDLTYSQYAKRRYGDLLMYINDYVADVMLCRALAVYS